MCKFGLSGVTVSNNGTQFSSVLVTDFFRESRAQMKFIFVVHPQSNEHEESTNKVIM